MLVTPDSTIELYGKVPITAGREVIFSSAANQRSYFVSKRIAQDVDCSYVRKTGRLKIEHPTSQVAQCNFIGFKNTAFENKWIYARILDYNYINNVTTEITYAIDWFQTHMFDCTFFDSQIEREHLSETDWNAAVANPFRNDILELNTPEDITVGSEDYEKINTNTAESENDYLALPGITTTAAFPRFMVVFGITDFGAVSSDTPVGQLVTFLNTFESEPTLPVTVDALLEVESGRSVITPDNVLIGNFPNSVRIYMMREQQDLAQMIDLMTLAGVTNNIIGIYYIPADIIGLLDNNLEIDKGKTTTIQWSGKVISPNIDPKLSRAPFSYIEILSPDGNIKELHYETFVELVNGGQQFRLNTVFTLHGTPLLSVIPYKYNRGSYTIDGGGNVQSGSYSVDYNIKERLDFGAFPQVGYSLDGYLTFLSNVYNETIRNRTVTKTLNNAGGILSSLAGLAGTIASVAGGGTSAAVGANTLVTGGSSFIGSITSPLETIANERMLGQTIGKIDPSLTSQYAKDVYSDELRALKNGDLPQDIYGVTASAYCNDEYHAGTGGNYTAYDIGFIGFMMYFKRINASKRALIAQYLKCYGYRSGRIGVPRVCNYITGNGATPHFATIDNKQCTYVKTAGMQVEAPHEVASSYIQSLFDLGCRFEKGD